MTPLATLKQYFGYDRFRPLQDEIIQAAMAGQDAIVIMPTGGGKSICYQIPALVREGFAVVVSPLIALMQDQVDGLRANGVEAAFLNSSQNGSEQATVYNRLQNGEIELLYVSPEKMVSGGFLSFLQKYPVNLFAIDEAHCISAWGHDFRPEYTQLSALKSYFPHVPVMALTATADKITRRDIRTQLELDEPNEFIASFDRPNLSLNVRPGRNRLATIRKFLELRPNSSGIIYCLSRKATEQVASALLNQGFEAEAYHAGMSASERRRVQQEFLSDKLPIVCATIAFGMGIDKSNVRWVIHYNLPKNVEGYYQEIGRAGRDGLPSDTMLLYSYGDVMQLRRFAQESTQSEVQLAKLERMQQYAEAQICRRRVLLAYFGEELRQPCGNCDVCKNPPRYFDGTEVAQKALSAVYRLREQASLNTVIDVLRGSQRREILEKGYHQLKTFGVGANISFGDWQQYLHQMINAGIVEVAYDQGHALRLTPASHEILFRGRQVKFYRQVRATKATAKPKRTKSKRVMLVEELFERLRGLRKSVAERAGLRPYLVFSDATLQEMASERPVTERAMRAISGVGDTKYNQYGRTFMDEIMGFILEKRETGATIKGSTYLETLDLIQRGLGAEEIAKKRGIHISTVYTHVAQLYTDGHSLPTERFISEREVEAVGQALRLAGNDRIADLAEHLEGVVEYDKIRLGLAMVSRN